MPTPSDDEVARLLNTPEGQARFRDAVQLASAKAADTLTEGTLGWYLARRLAGLPLFPPRHRKG